MPNWCSNYLIIKGTKEAMSEFYAVLNKEPSENPGVLSMQKFVPRPAELDDTTSPSTFIPVDEKRPMILGGIVVMVELDKDNRTREEFEEHQKYLRETYGATDWYQWNLDNWGTKWDVCEPEVVETSEDEYIISYDTAWSPNNAFLATLAMQFPELEISNDYEESGMCFCGTFYAHGESCYDEDKDWDSEHPSFRLTELEDGKYKFDDNEGDVWVEYYDGDWLAGLQEQCINEEDIVNFAELEAFMDAQ